MTRYWLKVFYHIQNSCLPYYKLYGVNNQNYYDLPFQNCGQNLLRKILRFCGIIEKVSFLLFVT